MGGAARPHPDLHEVEGRPTSSRSRARGALVGQKQAYGGEGGGVTARSAAMGGAPGLVSPHEVEEEEPTRPASGAREGLWGAGQAYGDGGAGATATVAADRGHHGGGGRRSAKEVFGGRVGNMRNSRERKKNWG
ncbi:hypothetical protein NL676_039017 [Syzygium grande]|nr:hypothetical protein NL676_039017 [Syzygium grande]